MHEKIKALARDWQDEFIAVRRHLHAHPELSYQEHNTAKYVFEYLEKWGLKPAYLAETGVAAMLHSSHPGERVIALRADMDALPITEENEVPYKSTVPGVMHACGHDVHTACLLGAAKILLELKDEWTGSVKLIFQPGEEKNPGGASLMIKDGVLENPKPQKILGLHTHLSLPVGAFSFRGGKAMASADEIYLTLSAKGGHAAAPHLTSDPILAAAHIITGLQTVISRMNNPLNPSVLSITEINGGNTTNVIPSSVKLKGTFRAMDEEWRFRAHGLIRNIVENTAASFALEAALTIDVGYPFVYNDPEVSSAAMQLAKQFAGDENVSETELRMGAEDFAYYSQQIPACFYRLGIGNEAKDIVHNAHTPLFDVDEGCIAEGMGMMAWLATQI